MLAILLVVGVVRIVSVNRARSVYEEQVVLSAGIATNAIRLGHDAQRYVMMDWQPHDTSPAWLLTYTRLRTDLDSFVSDVDRLSHSTDTRELFGDVVGSWNIVESKTQEAQRNLSALLGVSELVDALQDKSLVRAHNASWEYPHYLDPKRIFFLDRAVGAFTDLSLSAEIFGDVVTKYRVALITEASVAEQTNHVTVVFTVAVALILIGIVLVDALRRVRVSEPAPPVSHDTPGDELARITQFRAVPPRLADESAEEFPHWLSSAIREYHNLTRLDYRVDQFVQLAGRTPEYVSRTVKAWFGVTLTEFLRRERLARAIVMLREGDETIASIAHHVGFHSESYFYRSFREEFGLTPAQYRNLAAASTIGSPASLPDRHNTRDLDSNHRDASA